MKDGVKYYTEWKRFIYRLPRESVLGPLLFLICINGLPQAITVNAELVFLADNTSALIRANS